MIELADAGLTAEAEKPMSVYYKERNIGSFRADIVVENSVIIEIKSVEILTKAHEVQLVNYLTSSGIEDGILVNFGEQFAVKRKFKTFRKV